ncbi:hypothetical protein HZS_5033, partial [Henneguya salminicola]
MPRILVKGGIWKNTEDEILKVAVMKYGKNQWSRIASLLHKKTAKQCKSRWYEWLDPGIKKTEWTREEDEKLLHLAKLMPTQWRTIAPMVGRTANQCLERYEYLLDQAQLQESGLGDAEDPRKLRPGEVDPNPETKPARPDPIDMDEDELEMLSEARARLANTQGKKAKRKAREKQLDEARYTSEFLFRRLATLQKKRELRAAGVNLILLSKLKRCCDLNFEVPFEKKPTPGFYDTSDEKVDPTSEDFKEIRLKEYTRRDRIEILERRKDKEKYDKMKQIDLVGTIKKNAPPTTTIRRSKLILPAPQISESELEEVVKLGAEAELAKSFVSSDGDNLPTRSLLNDYSMTPMSTSESLGTRTPLATDNIMKEAQTLIALNMVETPLKGGVNVPMSETELTISGSKPQIMPAQTPNTVLASPYMTPGRSGDKEFTPLRDNLNINRDSASTSISTTPIKNKFKNQFNKHLRDQLSSLPSPVDDFEIEIPDVDESIEASAPYLEPDAAEAYEKQQHLQLLEDERKLSLQHQSVKRQLPIPSSIESNLINNSLMNYTDKYMQKAEKLILDEMCLMINHDVDSDNISKYEFFQLEEIELAKSMLESEITQTNISSDIVSNYNDIWDDYYSTTQAGLTDLSKNEQIELFNQQSEIYFKQITKNNKSIKKLNDKLNVLNGGYVIRCQNLNKEIIDISDQIEKTNLQLSAFQMLQQKESIGGPLRLKTAQDNLENIKSTQRELQIKYTQL